MIQPTEPTKPSKHYLVKIKTLLTLPLYGFDATTKKLADRVLQEPGGERFLMTAVCLEYLHGKISTHYGDARDDETDDPADSERDDDEMHDLEEAGADWLSEQGFDRRD